MKSLWKLIVVLAGLSLVVGFFLPWFSMILPGSLGVNYNGLEIYQKMDSILPLVKDRPYLLPYSLLFFPVLGVLVLVGSSFRIKPIFIFLFSFLLLGYFIYMAVDIAILANKVQKEFMPPKDLLKNFSIGNEKIPFVKPLLKDLFQLGKGLWVTLTSLIVLLLASLLQSRSEKKAATQANGEKQ